MQLNHGTISQTRKTESQETSDPDKVKDYVNSTFGVLTDKLEYQCYLQQIQNIKKGLSQLESSVLVNWWKSTIFYLARWWKIKG